MLEQLEFYFHQFSSRVFYRYQDEEITYHDLYLQAKALSEQFQKQGTGPVILYGPKNVKMVIGIFACLLSRRAYIPVDVWFPHNRIQRIIELSQASFFYPCVDCNESYVLCDDSSFTNREIAYILFTSGSTGEPKGVPIRYSNLENFIRWILRFPVLCDYQNEIILQQASFSFDLSVADFYYSFFTGQTLVGLESSLMEDVNALVSFLRKERISIFFVTPSFLKFCIMNPSFDEVMLPDLKCIYFCGEMLDVSLAKQVRNRFSQVVFINAYGPTEATSAVSGVLITDDMLSKQILPVGEVSNFATPIFIRDEKICLTGPSLCSGYLTGMNSSFFETSVSYGYDTGDLGEIRDGYLYCFGREDAQVKYKGYRIDLREIEYQLNQLKEVMDSLVIAKKKNGRVLYLKAYVVLDGDVSMDLLKERLKESLPFYMIPKNIVSISHFVLNSNGKIDRSVYDD